MGRSRAAWAISRLDGSFTSMRGSSSQVAAFLDFLRASEVRSAERTSVRYANAWATGRGGTMGSKRLRLGVGVVAAAAVAALLFAALATGGTTAAVGSGKAS